MNATGEKALYAFVGLVVGAVATYVAMDFLHERELDDIYNELDGLREDAAADALEKYQGGAGTDGTVVQIHNHVPPTSLPLTETESGGAGDIVVCGEIAGIRIVDEEGSTHCTHDVPLDRPCAMCEETLAQDIAAEHFVPNCAHGVPINEDCAKCDGAVPEDEPTEEAHLVAHPWDSDSAIRTTPGGQPMDEEDVITEDRKEAAALEAMAIADAEEKASMPTIIPDNKVTQPTIIGKFNRDDGSFEIAKAMSIAHPDLDEIIENDALYSLIGEEAFDILMDSLNEDAPETLRTVAVRNTVLHVDFVVQY